MDAYSRKGALSGDVIVPGSKSHTIRAVMLAALAKGTSVVHNPLPSKDGLAAMAAARALGATVEIQENTWVITGVGGRPAAPDCVIDVMNSGTVTSFALGIGGLVGAGRSELVEGIFGMHPLSGGEIFVNGKQVKVSSPQDIIKEGVALITEDRKVTGLNLSGTVNDNIAMVAIKKLLKNGLYSKSKARKASEEYIDKLSIKTPSVNQIVGNLSGGNQQKIVIAKWLLNDPDIIILDEPTRGIDVGAKRDIYLLLGNLVQQGKAVIMISSEIPELMGICDRIMVMCEGNYSGEVTREEFTQERIMTLASAIKV